MNPGVRRSPRPFRCATSPSKASLGSSPCLLSTGEREQPEIPPAVREWLDLLVTEVERSRRSASEQLAQLDELISRSQQLESGMCVAISLR